MKLSRFLIISCLVAVFSFFQALDISFIGVKPNFALIIIVVASFFIADIWEGVFLVAIASLILKFSPHLEKEILIFFATGVLIMVVGKYLPWHSIVSSLFLIAFYTLVFYLFLFPRFIFSVVFLEEIIYNLFIGGLTFVILSRLKF